MKSGYAALPTAEKITGDRFWVYFCGRDAMNRSQIGRAEVDLGNPGKKIRFSSEPVFTNGELGAFDDNGVTPTWLETAGRKKYLYYVGWNKGATVRMHLHAGLAVSQDGGRSFKRVSRAPILDRITCDPLLTASLCVLREKGVWRMWYVSGDHWEKRGDETFPYYNIKYAESRDGIHWERDGRVCIDFASKKEHALARPCVLKEGSLYRMWYSYKGDEYAIGYAESRDGLRWMRKDASLSFGAGSDRDDSQMQAYAFVFHHKGRLNMLYNGNEYGKYGICHAIER